MRIRSEEEGSGQHRLRRSNDEIPSQGYDDVDEENAGADRENRYCGYSHDAVFPWPLMRTGQIGRTAETAVLGRSGILMQTRAQPGVKT